MGRPKKIDRDTVIDLYKSGMPVMRISVRMGCSKTTVNDILRQAEVRRLYYRKSSGRAGNGCANYDPEEIKTCLNCQLPECRSKSAMCPLQRRKIG